MKFAITKNPKTTRGSAIGRIVARYAKFADEFYDKEDAARRLVAWHRRRPLQLTRMAKWPRHLDIIHDVSGILDGRGADPYWSPRFEARRP